MAHKLALIGFGSVAKGLIQILHEKGDAIRNAFGFDARIVAVCTLSRGSIYHPDGLDLAHLFEIATDNVPLKYYRETSGLVRGWDSLTTIRDSTADSIVEISHTDIETGQPAIDHCKAAFEAGKHVVTANKGPVALAHAELSALAQANGVRWGVEGTVMSGTPALRLPLAALAGTDITEIRGILNGTTNYILTKMEEGLSYDTALQQAQELGYAEADPTADVEGYDALSKVVILGNMLMGVTVDKDDVNRQGISHLTPDHIERARAEGKRWKLIGRVKKKGAWIVASVRPEMISQSDPLAGVAGATNAITYETDFLGPVTLVGAGAGPVETGYSILIDLINIERGSL